MQTKKLKILGALTSLVLFGSALPVLGEATPAKIIEVVGSVHVVSGRTSGPAQVGQIVGDKASFESGRGARCIVELMPGVNTALDENTEIQILRNDFVGGASPQRDVLISLTEGTVISSLKDASQGTTDFKIRTSAGVATARGTRFVVRKISDTEYQIIALEGSVTIKPTGIGAGAAPIILEAGTSGTLQQRAKAVTLTFNDADNVWEIGEIMGATEAGIDVYSLSSDPSVIEGKFGAQYPTLPPGDRDPTEPHVVVNPTNTSKDAASDTIVNEKK